MGKQGDSTRSKKVRKRKRGPFGALATGALLASSAWIVYSQFMLDHELPLPNAIPAERQRYDSKVHGHISFYVERKVEGRPLVLLHSINAAASAYEMRPLFEHYRSQRPVFALDWPGYGFSERSDRVYSPLLFENTLVEFLTEQVGEAVDVIALSLGCEFAARAAYARPDLFNSLALISPSGLSGGAEAASQVDQFRGGNDLVYFGLTFPLWSQALFDLIASRRSIDYFLSRSFVGAIPPGLADYSYLTSHQPGAHHAPLHFLSGKLFTPNIVERVYKLLETPTLVLYDEDAYVNFERLPETLAQNPNWQAARIVPTRGLPQFEKLPETVAELDAFWQGLA